MSGQNSAPAGWYPDPSESQRVRYWDGVNWSGASCPASPSAATAGVLESSAAAQVPRPWWQTWFGIVSGLLLCLSLGLLAACGDARSPTMPASSNCTPGYTPCLPPASDYDCASGKGDGPKYVDGPIEVTGSDPYGLDGNNDGVGCES